MKYEHLKEWINEPTKFPLTFVLDDGSLFVAKGVEDVVEGPSQEKCAWLQVTVRGEKTYQVRFELESLLYVKSESRAAETTP